MSKKITFPPKSPPASPPPAADAWVTDQPPTPSPSPQIPRPAAAQPTRKLTVDVPAELYQRARVQLLHEGGNLTALINAFLQERFPHK